MFAWIMVLVNGIFNYHVLRNADYGGFTLSDAKFEDPAFLTKMNASLSSWMGAIEDNTRITELSIPGAHDTMALYFPIAQCQNAHLDTLLQSGHRALDIRIRVINKVAYIYHGIVYQYATFDDVKQTCQRFLKQHPTETIFLRLLNEKGDLSSFLNFRVDLAKTSDFFFETRQHSSLHELNIGNVRGRIVLDYEFSMQNVVKQDEWKLKPDYSPWDMLGNSGKAALDKKKEIIRHALEKAIADGWGGWSDANRTHLYVHFLSAVGPFVSGVPAAVASGPVSALLSLRWFPDLRTKKVGDLGTNDFALDVLDSHKNKRQRVGIVYADFMGSSLMYAIIARNPFRTR